MTTKSCEVPVAWLTTNDRFFFGGTEYVVRGISGSGSSVVRLQIAHAETGMRVQDMTFRSDYQLRRLTEVTPDPFAANQLVLPV